MKKAHILHNPTSGSQEVTKKELIDLFESAGFECGYSSTKKLDWKDLKIKSDFIVIAGGDGTVRKVAVRLLYRDEFKNIPPLFLMPLGTANNVAHALGLNGQADSLVHQLDKAKRKKYDVAEITGMGEDRIILESFGYGVFPLLMKTMKEIPEREEASPEENLMNALHILHGIVKSYPAHECVVKVDGVIHAGHYLMVEVMNTPSIGPNLRINPDADVSDGKFEVILINESQRDDLAEYIQEKIDGRETRFQPAIFRGSEISIACDCEAVHIDDELEELKEEKKVRIRVQEGVMEFFV